MVWGWTLAEIAIEVENFELPKRSSSLGIKSDIVGGLRDISFRFVYKREIWYRCRFGHAESIPGGRRSQKSLGSPYLANPIWPPDDILHFHNFAMNFKIQGFCIFWLAILDRMNILLFQARDICVHSAINLHKLCKLAQIGSQFLTF